MRRYQFALSLSLVASAGLAQQGGDPLQSADCRQALDALQAQEDRDRAAASSTARQAEGLLSRGMSVRLARLKTLRDHAARACLGSRTDAPLPTQRFGQPPTAVPAVVIPPAQPALPAGPVMSVPKRAEPPLTVMICDAAGCLASDGSRLQYVGPNLLGPRGMCSVQGAVLQCP